MEESPFIGGQLGTLLQHGLEERDGQMFRTFTQGPINGPDGKPTGYAVGSRGELRHATPQFKGTKKQRLRFRKKVIAAYAVTPPAGYFELPPDEKVVALDLIINVETGKWMVTPFIGVEVRQLAIYFPKHPRACRKTPDAP